MTRRTFLTFTAIILVAVTLTVVVLAGRVRPVSPSPTTVVVTTTMRYIAPPRMSLPSPSPTVRPGTH